MQRKKTKVKFDNGVHTVHVPFMPPWGAYGELHSQIARIDYPKDADRIEATITVSIDLHGDMDWEGAEVKIIKKVT